MTEKVDKWFKWMEMWLINTPRTLAKDENKTVRVLAYLISFPWSLLTAFIWLPVCLVLLIIIGATEWFKDI